MEKEDLAVVARDRSFCRRDVLPLLHFRRGPELRAIQETLGRLILNA